MERKITKYEDCESWEDFGIYYGYPECCIKSFCGNGADLTKEQELVHKKTGFIPCHECSMKIMFNDTTLEGLIKNRICKTPFPIDETTDVKNMNAIEKLSKYGAVKTCKLVRDVATIVLTKGFSTNAKKTMEFLKECTECFPDHPIVETCITEEDFAMVVLVSRAK